MNLPEICPTDYPESAERNKEDQKNLLKKMQSCSIKDYCISLNNKEDIMDTCCVIIGLNNKTLEMDLYGYDYNIKILEYMLENLKNKFKDYTFIIKRFDSVL